MLNIDQATVTKSWKTFSVDLPATAKDIADLYMLSTNAWEKDHPNQTIYDDSVEVFAEGDEGDDQRIVFRYEIEPESHP